MTDKHSAGEQELSTKAIDQCISEIEAWAKNDVLRLVAIYARKELAALQQDSVSNKNGMKFALAICEAIGYHPDAVSQGDFPSKQVLLDTIGLIEEQKCQLAALTAATAEAKLAGELAMRYRAAIDASNVVLSFAHMINNPGEVSDAVMERINSLTPDSAGVLERIKQAAFADGVAQGLYAQSVLLERIKRAERAQASLDEAQWWEQHPVLGFHSKDYDSNCIFCQRIAKLQAEQAAIADGKGDEA